MNRSNSNALLFEQHDMHVLPTAYSQSELRLNVDFDFDFDFQFHSHSHSHSHSYSYFALSYELKFSSFPFPSRVYRRLKIIAAVLRPQPMSLHHCISASRGTKHLLL